MDAPITIAEENPENQTIQGVVSQQVTRLLNAIGPIVLASMQLDPDRVGALRAARLARVLGIEKNLCGRVVRALKEQEPLDAAYALPGPDGLRIVVQAAAKLANKDAIQQAHHAIDAYEDMIHDHTGTYNAFRVLVSGWIPEARKSSDQASRQQVYKGLSHIFGYQANVSLITYCYAPAKRKGLVDSLMIRGLSGIHTFREDVLLPPIRHLTTSATPQSPYSSPPETIDGEPIGPGKGNGLLTNFCSTPTPSFRLHVGEQLIEYWPQKLDIGLGDELSYFFADVRRNIASRYRTAEETTGTVSAVVSVPCKVLLLDVLVHEDMWPNATPRLSMYWIGRRGPLKSEHPDDRQEDQMACMVSVAELGMGPRAARTSDLNQYSEMLGYALDTAGWDSKRFRVFRCRMQYPVMGSQILMSFPLMETMPK